MSRNDSRSHQGLTITELAVDPADVDETTYPVRIRLSRAVSPQEARALATLAPEARIDLDSVVLPRATLDDVAHDAHVWEQRLEQAESMGRAMSGAATRAADEAHQRLAEQHRDLTRDSSVQNYMH
jgi:hypothetical protein